MIPVSLEKQLIPGTLEYAMHYINVAGVSSALGNGCSAYNWICF
jgi:hypothetical protein